MSRLDKQQQLKKMAEERKISDDKAYYGCEILALGAIIGDVPAAIAVAAMDIADALANIVGQELTLSGEISMGITEGIAEFLKAEPHAPDIILGNRGFKFTQKLKELVNLSRQDEQG